MKVAEDNTFRKVDALHPLLGLNSEDPSTQMDLSYATKAENILIRDGKASRRTGYFELIATAVPASAEVMAMIDFELLDGTRQFVVVTDKMVLRFDSTNDLWVDISPLTDPATAYNITAVDTATDKFTIAGNHASEFTVGGGFQVKGSSAGVHDRGYTVVTATDVASDTEIVVTFDITSSSVSGNIDTLDLLTAQDGDDVDFVTGTDATKHRLFITNNRDEIMTWDGSTTTRFLIWRLTANYPSTPSKIVCKTLNVFFDHLVLGAVALSGTAATSKSVIWSDVIDFDEFVTGTSGETLLPGLSGAILSLETIGDRLAIYSNDTIAMMLFVGFPLIFSFEIVVENTRLVSARAIVPFGPAHLYCSQENFYFFDGTRNIRPVGDRIRVLYKQDLDITIGNRLFTFNDVNRRLIFITVPRTSTVSSTFVFDYSVFDLKKFRWTRYEYNDRPTSMGTFLKRSAIPSWLDPPLINWDEDTGIWDEASEKVDFPLRVLGAKSQVFIMDEIITTDDTIAVTATYESVDFVVPEADISHIGRWLEIEGDFSGNEVEVLFSTDQGATFTSAETLTLTSISVNRTVFIDTIGRTLRIQLKSNKQFSVRWLRIWTSVGYAR